ncbi:hypothetical protein CVD28_00500 [Bacillus sp. M6-12]|uniref:hypothetical protein n=1 Tax=Bacillus sp. M6-12 TaxID=2054166 RepID=UPI000C76BAD3|nr:hypothetical protein [Bacillus sp. M6-12]PLS18914.1 hypothetical protein CVD28_00500 [Bacillus sp. M6-12]
MNDFFEETLLYLLKTFGLDAFLHIKDLFVFISAFLGGIIVQLFLIGWIWRNVRSDTTLKNIAVLRVPEEGKTIYYTNPHSALDIVHKTILILLLKLSKKKKITIADARKSKITIYILISLLLLVFLAGLFVATNHIDVLRWTEILKEIE